MALLLEREPDLISQIRASIKLLDVFDETFPDPKVPQAISQRRKTVYNKIPTLSFNGLPAPQIIAVQPIVVLEVQETEEEEIPEVIVIKKISSRVANLTDSVERVNRVDAAFEHLVRPKNNEFEVDEDDDSRLWGKEELDEIDALLVDSTDMYLKRDIKIAPLLEAID